MNVGETIQRFKATLATWASSMRAFYRRNRLTVLGGFTIVSIMLVVWARLGFTFEINRFFAAEVPSPANLQVQCSGFTATLTWNIPANANSNAIQKSVNGGTWVEVVADTTRTQVSYTEAFVPTTRYRHKSGANVASNEVQCPAGTSSGNPGTVLTVPSPVTLSVQCGATQNILTWTQNTGSEPVAVLKNIDSADGVTIATLPAATRTYTDMQISAGHAYRYRIKNSPTSSSNFADCPLPTPTPTLTPTPTPSPTVSASPSPTTTIAPGATPIAVVCAPIQQSRFAGQSVALQASGGTPPFQWYAPGGNPSGGTGASFNTVYAVPGDYQVGLTDSVLQSTQCDVAVFAPTPVVTPTPTPTSAANITVGVSGRNFSTSGVEGSSVVALAAQDVEVVARVVNSGLDIANNVLLTVSLSDGLTYVNGSTSIGNAPVTVDSVAGGGLALGALGPGQDAVVRFRVRVNGAVFPAGQSQAILRVQVTTDGVMSSSGSVAVVVNRPIAAGQPGTVNTGPGETTLVALLLSAIMSLLYVSYTHSPAFRRREANKVSADQGPLDFRS